MEQDQIKEIGVDDKGRLYITPLSKEFPYIYREAMEVHWDRENKFLYSPKPREWSYFDWFKQIILAAKKQSCFLYTAENTTWINIPNDLKSEIINEYR